MNVFLKYAGMLAVAVSLAGCRDDCRNGEACAEKSAARYTPKVAADARFALFVNHNDSPFVASVIDVCSKAFAEKVAGGDLEAKKIEKLLKDVGLNGFRFNWCVASFDVDLAAIRGKRSVSLSSLVVKGKHDGVKIRNGGAELFAALFGKAGEFGEAAFETVDISGVQALKCVIPVNDATFILYFASLGDQLMIFAGSEEKLETQIALYRDNAEASAKFDALLSDKDIVLGGVLADIGKMFAEAEKGEPEDVKMIASKLGQINYREFKTLDFGIRADKSGSVTVFADLETGVAEDAQGLAAMLQAYLTGAIAQYTQFERAKAIPHAAVALEALKATDVKTEGAKVTVRNSLPRKAVDLVMIGLERVYGVE